MAEPNRQYEVTFIVSGRLEESAALGVVDEIRHLIESEGGSLVAERPWGKRRLEYPIEKETSGYYQTVVFALPPEAVVRLEAALKSQPSVIRHLLVGFVEPAVKRPPVSRTPERAEPPPKAPIEGSGVKLEEALEEILKE